MGSLGEKLREAAGGDYNTISDFDGQVLTIVSIAVAPSPFRADQKQVTVTAVNGEGEEVTFYATPTAGRQLIAIEEDLPQDLKVVSFPGQFGKTGYKFEEPDEA